jgi:hypothetical protein
MLLRCEVHLYSKGLWQNLMFVVCGGGYRRLNMTVDLYYFNFPHLSMIGDREALFFKRGSYLNVL